MSEPLRIWWNRGLKNKISAGKLAAQVAHAALRAYGIQYDHPIVVLSAGRGRIEQMPVVIHDAGRTELRPGTLTAGVEERRQIPVTDAMVERAARAIMRAGGLERFLSSPGLYTLPHWVRAKNHARAALEAVLGGEHEND